MKKINNLTKFRSSSQISQCLSNFIMSTKFLYFLPNFINFNQSQNFIQFYNFNQISDCFSLQREAICFQVVGQAKAKCLLKFQWMHTRTHLGFICLTLVHCVFSDGPSNYLSERMHIHIGCICFAFLQCAFSNGSSNCLPERMHIHIGCICLAFLHCVFSNESSNCLPKKRQSCIGCICFLILLLHCLCF